MVEGLFGEKLVSKNVQNQIILPAEFRDIFDEENTKGRFYVYLEVRRSLVFSTLDELVRDFVPEAEDRRSGTIITEPMVGRYVAEFWRKDASTRADMLEGALQTVYRTATVKITPNPDQQGAFVPVVRVDVVRLNKREPMVTNASQAYDLFSPGGQERLRVETGEPKPKTLREKMARERTPLGRDKNLELILSRRITARACTLGQ